MKKRANYNEASRAANNDKSASQLSLADQVSQQIQQAILTHQLAVGDRLPTEPQLMAHFGVGRSTIREAVRVLVNLGLLKVQQGKGTTIISDSLPLDQDINNTFKTAPIIEAYEARKSLELGIVHLACHNRTADDLKAMAYYLEVRAAAARRLAFDAYRQADQDFHEAISTACHNQIMIDIYAAFWQSFKDRFSEKFTKTEHYEEQTNIHENILNAINQQDPVQASQWVEKNISLLEQLIGHD